MASVGATTIPHTFVGLDEGDAYIVTVNRTDATGTTKNPASSTETFIGKVSGTNFINCVREVEGAAQAWAADIVLEILMSATWANKVVEGLEVEHNQTGTHKAALVTTLKATGAEVTTGTSDVKIVTPKALADAGIVLVDEDDMASNSATKVPSQQSVKAYVDSGTTTITNKRVTKRIATITSHATPTINTDNCDCVTITAQAEAITSMTTNLSGTPTNFQALVIRIKDNGTARGITWGASFEAKGVALPTTTVISKVLTVGFIYDTTTSKWGCVASVQEA